MTTEPITTQQPAPPVVSCRAYIENGILFTEYVGEFSAASAYKVETEAVKLLTQHNLHHVPCITIMKDAKFKFPLKDYSKVVSFGLVKYISGAWIVGLSGDTIKVGEVVNKLFFGGRMHFCNSIEEAKESIRQTVGDSETILETAEKPNQ